MGGEEGTGVTTGQPNLYKQDLSKLDISKLTALSREVISRQATINIGTIGHVAHGKSTIVKAISGVQTVRFKNELERNITIKLDARAAETSSEERAEVPDNAKKTLSTCEKRPLSPGGFQPPAKQSKHDDRCISPRLDARDVKQRSPAEANTSVEDDQRKRTANQYDCNENSSVESNGCRRSVRNRRHYKLRELRIVLEDVKHMLKHEDGFREGKEESDQTEGDKRENEDVSPNEKGESSKRVQESGDKMKKPSGENQWEVEKILAKKERNGASVYLIKWKDWSAEYNTWEPVSNLENCAEMLELFETSRSQLMDNFKAKVNFYPTVSDVENYLNEIKYNGETLDSVTIDDEAVYAGLKTFFKQKLVKNSKWERNVKRNILRAMLCDMRKEQLDSLQDWEDEMNSITKGKPSIRVENAVDLEAAPQDFYYIDDYLPGADVVIPDDPPIGCDCASCDSKTNCCFAQHDGTFPYTSAGRVRVPPGTPIFECNKRCRCDANCLNRVVQRGANTKLSIFRTSNGRGWGVKTLRSIKKGAFVIQYVGEVVTSDEAEKRGKKYDAAGRTYLFDLDYNETEGQCPYTVDAAMYGNVSHFINHSCDPNLAVYGVWVNCLDPNLPKLALFATRDIKQNEEITFDYMCQSSRSNEKSQTSVKEDLEDATVTSESKQKLDGRPETPESDVMSNKTLCKCGARTCRRYLF